MERSPSSYETARFLLAELFKCGINHYCICPGSRSTSLALCAWELNSASISVHHDERSGGFFALGKAIQVKQPVAIITTSGTAVAELLPAAVEASLSHVPVVFLSADRPKHLRRTGANQTIDQVDMLAPYVKCSLEIPLLNAGSLKVMEKKLRRSVHAALEECMGTDSGPLHINVQLEKPFEPKRLRNPSSPSQSPQYYRAPKDCFPTESKYRKLRTKLTTAASPILVVGPNRLGLGFPEAAREFARSYNMPLLADPLSGCRGGGGGYIKPVDSYELLLQAGVLEDMRFDLVVRIGQLPISTRLMEFINVSLDSEGSHIYVNQTGHIHDENAGVTDYVRANPISFCNRMKMIEGSSKNLSRWLNSWHDLDAKARLALMDYLGQGEAWDGSYVATLLQEITPGCLLFAGNSLPIRLVDLVGAVRPGPLDVIANRGASGIDGIVSTALGLAHGHSSKVILLVGDTSFLYDVSGLAVIRKLSLHNILIVVMNNNGGAIFGRLPIAQLNDPFERLFINPNDLDFSDIARSFGISHSEANGISEFRKLLQKSLRESKSSILEVHTDWKQDLLHASEMVHSMTQHKGD